MSDQTAPIISKEAYHFVFTGRVQGVGFRATARHLAADMRLSGWVRNVPGGEVELLVEGPGEKIMDLVAGLKMHFSIHDMKAGKVPVSGKMTSFEIRY